MCAFFQKDIQTLAANEGLGSITHCACGTISLHIGGVSVRMDTAVFAETAAMCQQALHALPLQALLRTETPDTLH